MRSIVLLVVLVSAVSAQNSIYERFPDGANVLEPDYFMPEPVRTYKPNWKDIDSRPLPEWYDQAKIGIFLHWGVYSVPSFGNKELAAEWFWAYWRTSILKNAVDKFMEKNYRPGFTYQDFAPMFTAEFFDPDDWAKLFKESGAKYIVLTSKHHEGFTLFPSKRSFSWNSVDVGPGRDIVGELATAIKHQNLEFGIYHSLYEWHNPLYLNDKANGFKTNEFVNHKLWPDIKQLIHDYEPSVLWADGDWEADSSYWNSTYLLAWLYNDSPVKDRIVVNDRWGKGCPCKHGGFFNCKDRYDPGVLQKHKWENAFTMDMYSWGYRRNMRTDEILSMEMLIRKIVETVSCGGNALINVGPTKEGTIAPIFRERLLELGKWLQINGHAIYNTTYWYNQNDTFNSNVWYTCNKMPDKEKGYVIVGYHIIFLKWPEDNILKVKDIVAVLKMEPDASIIFLDGNRKLKATIVDNIAHFKLPDKATVQSKYAWTITIQRTRSDQTTRRDSPVFS